MAQKIRYYKQDGTEYDFSKEPEIKIMQTSNADMNIGFIDQWKDTTPNIGGQTQQTAVEWLVEQYANENYGIEVYEQAKQMEKEQIVEAYIKGGVNDFYKDEQAEQYYNETYKK